MSSSQLRQAVLTDMTTITNTFPVYCVAVSISRTNCVVEVLFLSPVNICITVELNVFHT